MGSLIGLVKPLLHIMIAAIILGTAGYLCAIFLTILAGQVIVHGILTGEMGAAIATETTDVALSAQTVGITVKNLWLINTPVKNNYYHNDYYCSSSRNPSLCRAVL